MGYEDITAPTSLGNIESRKHEDEKSETNNELVKTTEDHDSTFTKTRKKNVKSD